MRHPQTLLKAYQLGDKLEDGELECLCAEMQTLADQCWKFGEMFRLQAIYAQKVADDCRSFLKSRHEKAA